MTFSSHFFGAVYTNNACHFCFASDRCNIHLCVVVMSIKVFLFVDDNMRIVFGMS